MNDTPKTSTDICREYEQKTGMKREDTAKLLAKEYSFLYWETGETARKVIWQALIDSEFIRKAALASRDREVEEFARAVILYFGGDRSKIHPLCDGDLALFDKAERLLAPAAAPDLDIGRACGPVAKCAAHKEAAPMEKIESMVLAEEPCPDCGSGRHRSCKAAPRKGQSNG